MPQYRHVDKSRNTILPCMFQQHMLSVMLRETRLLPCVSSGSSDRRLPADSGSLVTGGDWSAATDPGGQCWRPRSCLLIPVQVSQTVFLTLFCLYCCCFYKSIRGEWYGDIYCETNYFVYTEIRLPFVALCVLDHGRQYRKSVSRSTSRSYWSFFYFFCINVIK